MLGGSAGARTDPALTTPAFRHSAAVKPTIGPAHTEDMLQKTLGLVILRANNPSTPSESLVGVTVVDATTYFTRFYGVLEKPGQKQ